MSNYSNNYNQQRISNYNAYNNSNRTFNNQTQRQRKHSGAKFGKTEYGYYVSAWKLSKGQMYVLYARQYSKSKVVTSENGKEWVNLFVTITNRNTMTTKNCSAMLDIDKKRLYIKELGLIATNNGWGGYFGKGGYKMNINR